MTALAARLWPKASAETVAKVDSFVAVAIFCGIGLLVSLTAILLNQQIPGEWF